MTQQGMTQQGMAQAKQPKVTIVGAGNVGATAALLLLLKDLANVVLIDVAADMAKGKALDLMHMRSNELFTSTVIGTGDYADTADSDVVVVTAGVPRKPGMTREDLIEINAGIVRSVLDGALPASPQARYLFVTNPLDVMVNLASKISGLPTNQLFGMGGVLDSARFSYAIAQELNVDPADIDALVVGAHGEAMVPLPRFSTVNGTPITELLDAAAIERVAHNTVQGGAAVVELLKTGSAFYAPGSSIVRMVEALLGNTDAVLPTCAYLNGEYGINDVYLCAPAHLDATGVRKVVELELNEAELAQLQNSAAAVKEQVGLIG
ncbi:MAG: malate dehydrogenase [Coriobacteriales bacterium]|jgi:malate dehydrogenase|nr:malate dehydrogenase [Coriobacteriales bacterium]